MSWLHAKLKPHCGWVGGRNKKANKVGEKINVRQEKKRQEKQEEDEQMRIEVDNNTRNS
jgi:hypothetical protein